MSIYDRIRALRIAQKMSQTDLAIKMGYKDGSMITKIESGKVDISQKKLMAFAKALSTTPAYLMGWTDEGAPDPASILSNEEKHLVTVYRAAEPVIQKAALKMLEDNPAKPSPRTNTGSGQTA